MAFLSVYDPDKKRKPIDKLVGALERYYEKTGKIATVALTSQQDAEALGGAPVDVRPRGYIGRHIFYVGQDDDDTTDRGVWL